MESNKRHSLASALAPLTLAVLSVLVPVITTWSWPFHYELPLILVTALVVGYVAFFSAGLPLIESVRKQGRLNWFTLICCGVAVGIVFVLLFMVGLGLLLGTLMYQTKSLLPWLSICAWGAGYGLATAVVYGFIAGGRTNSSNPTPRRGAA